MSAAGEALADRAEQRFPRSGAGASPRAAWTDLWAYASYLLLGFVVLLQLWRNPNGRVLASNDDDHGFFLFVLAHGERVVFHGASPFFDDRMNVPDGVNMMANTSVLALSLPFAPVTHFFGPGVGVVLLLTLGLAGTASAWYFVLSRHVVSRRLAAWIGGAWCGFCPAMVGHANGHINFVSGFVVPFLVWQVIRLREPGRIVPGGVILGLLVVLQVFLNEETLLFTAITLTIFLLLYAVQLRRPVIEAAPRFLAGLGVAALVAGVFLAYPLWFQFFGPGSYHGQPFPTDKYVTDLASIGAYARQSLAGNNTIARALSVSATEDNTFFGPPLVVVLVIAVVMLWRSVVARTAALTALVLLVMSMGTQLRVAGHETPVPLPFGLVSRLPIIDLVSVTRFAMVTATIVGVLLALAADRIRDYPRRQRVAFWAGLTVALLPVLPKPLPVVAADPMPPFLAAGIWHSYVPPGRTLVTVPLPEVTSGRTGMRWVALSGLRYASPRGYFMGPANPPADTTGSWSAPPRFTSQLLGYVGRYGAVPPVTDAARAAFAADLAYWRAGVVVLVPGTPNEAALRETLSALSGTPPHRVGGVELWVPSGG